MRKAHLLTIGTEIACGEIVNSNAAWISTQLENRGIRVMSHQVVRDQRDEILAALKLADAYAVLIVTGGLGPTSDDITRAMVAAHFGLPLEFDDGVWRQLEEVYQRRGLPLREAHRHQCHFPKGSRRLTNPVGTALGFALDVGGRQVFVLPGPPRELQAMWQMEVEPHLTADTAFAWSRWTCLGAPESEVAELVEAAAQGFQLELGYRASVPYVFVKAYLDTRDGGHTEARAKIEAALAPYVVASDGADLADELFRLWPKSKMQVSDQVTDAILAHRLYEVDRGEVELTLRIGESESASADLSLSQEGEQLRVQLRLPDVKFDKKLELPYRLRLNSERGRKSAAEWAIWLAVQALRPGCGSDGC